MTGSLAWPLAIVIGVLVLRRPIANLLAQAPLKRLKAGPFEVEIDRGVAEAETTLEAGRVIPPPLSEGSIREELSVEVVRAPAVAVLQAHHAVERELRDVVANLDIQRLSRRGRFDSHALLPRNAPSPSPRPERLKPSASSGTLSHTAALAR